MDNWIEECASEIDDYLSQLEGVWCQEKIEEIIKDHADKAIARAIREASSRAYIAGSTKIG